MEHHHDNHHPEGNKPVAFTVPLIMASVLLLIIVLLLSVCDPKHGGCECKEDCSKECMEKCEKGDHSSHDEHGVEKKDGVHQEAHATTEEHHDVAADTTSIHGTTNPKDSTAGHHNH
jgi:hypothetical protein